MEGELLSGNRAAYEAHRRGEAAFERGDLADAKRGFETAARLEPRSAQALLNLGMTQARRGEAAEALVTLERAAALQPRWSVVWQQRASVAADAKQLPQAREFAQRATALAPKSVDAWLVHSHVAVLGGQLAEAEQSARRALALDAKQPRVWLSLGDVLLRLPGDQRAGEAADAFRRAAALEPSPYTYRQLGEALRRAGRVPEAVTALRQAVELAPGDASCAYQLSLALRAAGDADEADRVGARARELQEQRYRLEALRRRLAQQPGNTRLHLEFARELARRGDRDGAITAYRKLLALDPENEAARRALARLEAGTGS